MVKNKQGCTKCGKDKSFKVFTDDQERNIYWFGAYKGSKDFNLLVFSENNVQIKFCVWARQSFPVEMAKKYDVYCTVCFESIMEQKKSERYSKDEENEF